MKVTEKISKGSKRETVYVSVRGGWCPSEAAEPGDRDGIFFRSEGEIKIFPGEHRLVGFMVNKTCVWAA